MVSSILNTQCLCCYWLHIGHVMVAMAFLKTLTSNTYWWLNLTDMGRITPMLNIDGEEEYAILLVASLSHGFVSYPVTIEW